MYLQELANEIPVGCRILILLLILTPNLEETCMFWLRNPSNGIMFEIVTWQFLLQLASG